MSDMVLLRSRCSRAGALCLLLAVAAAPRPVLAQRPLGIDVSHWQGPNVNWASVKASGVSFAWCKATEGVTFIDSAFDINMVNAKAAGVLIGGYHYARPDLNLGPAGAAQEAAHYWNTVSNYLSADGCHLMPVLDIEQDLSGAVPGYTKATLSQWVNVWCSSVLNRAAASGVTVTPVVYTYVYYASTWMDGTVTQWPLWMAQWPASPDPQTGSPSGTAPWPTWDVWQYSSTGSVPGVSGNCDQNVINGTETSLDALVIGGSGQPYITSQPSDRTADPGSTITLRAAASGGATLHYQWRINGTNLPAATNDFLTISDLQSGNAGPYSVVVTNTSGSVTSSVATLTINAFYVPVFADNFDVDSSANWILNRSSTDNRATFAYDHAALGIPSAPGSAGGTTRGLRFEANLAAGAVNALNVSPVGQGFPVVSRLHFDMWVNVNGPLPSGGTGSTEALTAGVGTAGNRVQWNNAGSTADGVWFRVDGEGGASDTSTTQGDFVAYRGANQQSVASGVYAAGTGATARGNFNSFYENVFPGGQTPPVSQQVGYPQQTGAMNPGTLGFAWRDVVVSRNGSTVDWFIDGLRVATVTGASLTASNVFVGYWDSFASLTDNTNLSFGLIDNLRVEVPAIAPSITAQPQSLWGHFGSNATFTVSASGLPTPVYQWRLDGADLMGATNGSLVLTNLQAGNAGAYSVQVSNLAGSQTSSNALLSLIADMQPQLQLVGGPAGGSVQLAASAETAATYALQTSTNLITWETLTSLVATNTSIAFDVPASSADARRYYRLRSGP